MVERLRQGERVGSGAMAEVYRGVLAGERGVQKPVAIKRLRADLRDDPRAVELFVNEASIAVRLAHPNVVQGLEFARDDDGYYLVCEWLDCVTLARVKEQHGHLPWAVVVHIGRALCDALTHVHGLTDVDGTALEIVHRDITPGNVFVTAAGRVKLGDFGVATGNADRGAVDVREVGTPGFAAPEQSDGAWDARSDVFGVGATLAALSEGLPAPVAAVIERATRPQPTDRFADARELGKALGEAAATCDGDGGAVDDVLREIVEQLEATPCAPTLQLDGAVQSILGGALDGPEPTPLAPPPPSKRVRFGLVAAFGAVAALVLVLALWFMRPPPEPAPELTPVGSEVPPPPPEVPPVDPVPEPAPPSVEPETQPKPVPPRPKPLPTVRVNINAVPWSSVTIDGRAIGNTPLRKVEVTMGKRQVVLTHPPDKTRRSFAIEVGDTGGQSFIFDLRRGTVEKRILPP